MKKLLLILTMLFVLMIPSFSFAADATYVIEDYHREITVHENNTYSVKDTMVVNWKTPAHGLRADIPTRAEIRRMHDGKEYRDTYQVIVSDIFANGQFSTERDGDVLQIRMGDPDEYVTGQKTYQFGYLFDPGDNKRPEFDEFYFNLIAPAWAAPIENFTFEINMPKEFDSSKIGFSTGFEGNAGYNEEALQYEVNGNTITGSIHQRIAPYEGVTIRIELPDGYFVGARSASGLVTPVLIASGVIFVIVLLFVIFNDKRRREIQTVEFNAPEGMTPADVGYIIDGTAETKDAVSLLIYWADQGNIEIHQQDKKKVFFKKIKDLPQTANDYERILFDKMFAGRDEISVDGMKYEFSGTISAVKSRLKDKFQTSENLVFTKKSLRLRGIATVLSVLPAVLMLAFSVYLDSYDWFAAIFAGGIAWVIGALLVGAVCKSADSWSVKKAHAKAGFMVFVIIACAIYFAVLAFFSMMLFELWVLLPIAVSVVMIILIAPMRRRTEKGALWTGRILGFKHFIETVEAEKLKMMVEEDPQYFYHVLPYAYVLGITDKWAKQFESIAVEPPDWYYGYDGSLFTTIWFASMISNSMNYTQQNMIAVKDSGGSGGGGIGGGGGFSGGGFSGGGFGGGGGSW